MSFTKGTALTLGWRKGDKCHRAYQSDTRIYFCEDTWDGREFCRQIYDKVDEGLVDASDRKDFRGIAEQDVNLVLDKGVWKIADRSILTSEVW